MRTELSSGGLRQASFTRAPPVHSTKNRENTWMRVSLASVPEMMCVMRLTHPTFNPVPLGFVIFTDQSTLFSNHWGMCSPEPAAAQPAFPSNCSDSGAGAERSDGTPLPVQRGWVVGIPGTRTIGTSPSFKTYGDL